LPTVDDPAFSVIAAGSHTWTEQTTDSHTWSNQ